MLRHKLKASLSSSRASWPHTGMFRLGCNVEGCTEPCIGFLAKRFCGGPGGARFLGWITRVCARYSVSGVGFNNGGSVGIDSSWLECGGGYLLELPL